MDSGFGNLFRILVRVQERKNCTLWLKREEQSRNIISFSFSFQKKKMEFFTKYIVKNSISTYFLLFSNLTIILKRALNLKSINLPKP